MQEQSKKNRLKKMDLNLFNNFFDTDKRLIKEHEFRKAVFRDGIAENDRSEIWKYLFDFYLFNSTPRERQTRDKEKAIEYYLMKSRWKQLFELVQKSSNENQELKSVPLLPFNININLDENYYKSNQAPSETHQINVDYIKIQLVLRISKHKISTRKLIEDIKQIDKDIERTSYLTEIEKVLNENEYAKIVQSLRNILITFAAFNQNLDENNSLGYTQGMNELASVFISVFNDESIAYWCFSNFMLFDAYSTSDIAVHTTRIESSHVLKTSVAHYFSDLGMSKKLKYLSGLLQQIDEELYKHLEKYEMDNLYFCHEWLILNFIRCFNSILEYQRCFEMIASHYLELHTLALKGVSVNDLYSFDLFICLALLKRMRTSLVEANSETDVFEILKKNHSLLSSELIEIVKIAEDIFDKYCIKSNDLNEYDQNDDLKDYDLVAKIRSFSQIMFG